MDYDLNMKTGIHPFLPQVSLGCGIYHSSRKANWTIPVRLVTFLKMLVILFLKRNEHLYSEQNQRTVKAKQVFMEDNHILLLKVKHDMEMDRP